MSTMDIDSIDVQSESAAESTLESEIDALSKIITDDTKDGAPKLEDNDDFKIDSDDLTFTANLQCDSIESDKCELLPDDGLSIKDILDSSGELENFISGSTKEPDLQEVLNETQTPELFKDEKETEERSKTPQEQTENLVTIPENTNENYKTESVLQVDPTNVNNSLSLINEAYNSQESRSCTESQPASVSEIEDIAELVNKSEVDDTENQQDATGILESVTNNENIERTFDLLNEGSEKIDSPIDEILIKESIDNLSAEESISQNLFDQNVENKSDDQTDFVQIIKSVENENTLSEGTSSKDVQNKKDNFVIGSPIENDDLDENKECINEQQNILSDIETNLFHETNDSVENVIIQENQEIEFENNSQNKTDDSIDSDVFIPEIQDPLLIENEESIASQVFEENIKEDTIDDQSAIQDNNENPNSELIITNDLESHDSKSENDEKTEEPMDIDESSNAETKTMENTKKSKEIESLVDIEINKTENEKIEAVDDEKNVEAMQNAIENINIDNPESFEKEKDIENLQDAKTDMDIVSLETAENIDNSTKSNIDIEDVEFANSNAEQNSEEDTDNNFSQDVETANITDPLESQELTDINTFIETSQESKTLTFSESSLNAKIIENNQVLQDTVADTGIDTLSIDPDSNMETLQDIESLKEEVNTENESSKAEEQSIKDEETAPTAELNIINETGNSNVKEIKQSTSSEVDKEEEICNVEDSEKIIEINENLNENSEIQTNDGLSEKVDETNDINSPESESLVDQISPSFENEEIAKNEMSIENYLTEKSENEDLIPKRVETPEDLNITLELEEPETLKEMTIETQDEQEPDTLKETTVETQDEQDPEALKETTAKTQDEQEPETLKETTVEILSEQESEVLKETAIETQDEKEPEAPKETIAKTQDEKDPEASKETTTKIHDEKEPDTLKESIVEIQAEQESESLKETAMDIQDEQESESLKKTAMDTQDEQESEKLKETTIDTQDIQEAKEKSDTIEDMEVDTTEKKEVSTSPEEQSTDGKQDTTEETEDQVEINLTLEPENYNSPDPQFSSEEQVVINNTLDELSNNTNINVGEIPEAVESDLNEILDANKKVNDITNDQGSDSQELVSSILKEVEKDLCTELNELMETEENIDKQVEDFVDTEASKLPTKELQPIDDKSQDSLSILDALPMEPMSVDVEKEENKESGSIEREDITLIFESSQSPKQTDKFINDLYNTCMPDDTNDTNDTSFDDILKSNESESVKEQENEDNAEKTKNENVENSKILDQESSTQLENETSELHSKLDDKQNEEITNELVEISELESAVKFLQESEEKDIENAKSIENITIDEQNTSIFVSVEENDNVSELVSDQSEVTLDPIAISEAEIISEAAKLESERKEKLELENQSKGSVTESSDIDFDTNNLLNYVETAEQSNDEISKVDSSKKEETTETKSPEITETKSPLESSSNKSMLGDDQDVPPKTDALEISSKISDVLMTSKTNLLVQKDAKQRLESPDRQSINTEPKITETPKKESSDKQQQQPQYLECENVGSPRIILKIAKSAIADCSEPRSPKSPKIRSAANSPNPEDSPSHKLGKIKLKLSKGGHPSIIPNNDNYDETAQWHTDSTSVHSPLGMKIKLTKSCDTTIESKHEESQKQEEIKEKVTHKGDEGRKTETPIGMKFKISKSGDASIVQQDNKETVQEASHAKKQDSPSIMKIKFSKSGDASIIPQDNRAKSEEPKETPVRAKDKAVEDTQECNRRTESPINMKIKFFKSGDASVISNEPLEPIKEVIDLKDKTEEPSKRTDSPIGVKIKLAKTKGGNASIITTETTEESKEKFDDSSKKSKQSKKREFSEETSEKDMTNDNDVKMVSDVTDEVPKTTIGMKIKLSKSGDTASVVHTKKEDLSTETTKKTSEQPLGITIKLSKTGDPSIIHSEVSKEVEEVVQSVKSKHSKNKDHGSIGQQKSKDDSHLEMKIKLSKTGHPSIITNEHKEDSLKGTNLPLATPSHKHKDLLTFKESTLKALKKSHSDVTIEPVKNQQMENTMIDLHSKRKDITISPVEAKKAKMEANLKQMLPDITIQPVASATKKEQQQQKLLLESNTGNISQQQMNVINQEISITQICSLSTDDSVMGEQLKSALNVPTNPLASSPIHSDCEIIEPQPELIIVNENSNSSQDIMIIDEVSPPKTLVKVPKKRGRPRRNANIASAISHTNITSFQNIEPQRDPLSLDQPPMPSALHIPMQHGSHSASQTGSASAEGNERPRRTCRSQKSYAPPKRGRGRGRGKRKNESVDIPMKHARIEQDLTAIENSTTAVITLKKLSIDTTTKLNASSELFKALNQPTLDQAAAKSNEVEILEVPQQFTETSIVTEKPTLLQDEAQIQKDEKDEEAPEIIEEMNIIEETRISTLESETATTSFESEKDVTEIVEEPVVNEDEVSDKVDTIVIKVTEENEKEPEPEVNSEQVITTESSKDTLIIQEQENWLAPSIKKVSSDSTTRNESISTLTVIDEETRMSAESGSRSQTPARNLPPPGTSETLVNEESQGSTATTESEKVKVRNRRMEISFDPDEGPFTVEKIAEYEWPLDRKDDKPAGRGETFMIQEQISQYLGVKSFKRKYPDLKRRMVDMEERNFLRENGLVSESMCDMGLTAVSSSEVLDIMCSDFPEQYEEYRKHMREKAAREHSKKQKELSAAANAERTRIDLAEMAMQSVISWNAGLNKARNDTRKCSLDLQTFTVQIPKRPVKYDPSRRGPHYPVALIPGQYTDYYREYTPAELRYYPLNTVLYGPMKPNERKFDSQSEGSQSDSDSDSSSDDSSSTSSEGTQDTEGSQSTMDDVDMEIDIQPDVKCKMCLNHLNKNNRPEVLIQCGTCNGNVHPSCIDLTVDMVPHIRAYAWQCTDCKTCAQCHDPADEDKMLFCDMCDRGYHIYCVGLRRVPQGRWHCQECAVCANCGSKEPGGANSDRNSVAQWQHEYKKGDKNTRVYVSTFCVPCSKMRGNQGADN